jgi:hypothetical protein
VDLTKSQERYAAAVMEYRQFRAGVTANHGPQIAAMVLGPLDELLKARSELVRDAMAALAQAVVEREALKLLSLSEEERRAAAEVLANRPAEWLRILTRDVVRTIHAAPVADKLNQVISGL